MRFYLNKLENQFYTRQGDILIQLSQEDVVKLLNKSDQRIEKLEKEVLDWQSKYYEIVED